MPDLYVFAVNHPLDITHTSLSRREGTVPDLPPLSDWLGGGDIDTDQIELFAVATLAEMPLATYLVEAFDVDEVALAEHRGRLANLEGHVLLVPEKAVASDPQPGADLTLIATLPMHAANNTVKPLPKADVTPKPAKPQERTKKPMSQARVSGMVATAALLFLFLFTALIVWIG
ncbi:hypothetical protein [Actibacterium sp. 188UL27-1]|uniref:hypothetical protein n=1 Tax=Actibacterium sp. 188UL27-1 TaxID=2786961 RepID=UPI00195A57BA|nr:hypothetical protein [Actibacterium sp. 188UL27-1]MBM7066053.1 hypothetical protein [Actibacterium sp. 188UL27-1]